ncbi:hypothetical protein V5799_014655 [Amblyomma americanum]|uniref:Uncharacterized protein n=1 Tax=Amblyomma americanum TaxID=6943 RepID=A0AAQ4E2D9_AMBAM
MLDRRSELIVRIFRGKFQPCIRLLSGRRSRFVYKARPQRRNVQAPFSHFRCRLRSFVSSAHEYCLSCLQRNVFVPVDDHSFRPNAWYIVPPPLWGRLAGPLLQYGVACGKINTTVYFFLQIL